MPATRTLTRGLPEAGGVRAVRGLGIRSPLTLALSSWVLVGLLAVSCIGPEDGSQGSAKQLTPDELAELLNQGTIRPITGPDGVEDAYGGYSAEEEMGADPFAGISPGIGEGDQTGSPPAGVQAPPAKNSRHGAEDREADPLEALEALAEAQLGTIVDPGTAAGSGLLTPARAALTNPLELFEENPYLTFGRRIKVYPDGSITKPYPLRPGTGEKMQKLIQDYGNFPIWTAEMGSGPSLPTMVKIDLLPEWDIELVQDIRNPSDRRGEVVPVADWLVVTTGEDLLWEVEEFINLFAAGVPQIEIEAKIVEITFTEALDIGIRPISDDVPIIDFAGSLIDKLNYSLPNQSEGIEGLLTVGGVLDGTSFNALIEAVAGNDNVSIISRPKVAVREGGRAQISSTQRIPFLEVTSLNNTGGFNTKLSYQETGVQLHVVPRVVGTDTVALDIDIEASQQSGNQVVATANGSDDAISIPILSQRMARTVVYLRPGQAVILGGLINERNVESIRKIPLLGDIPLIKFLFRSSFTSKEQSNVLFFIRPRILQGADLSRDF